MRNNNMTSWLRALLCSVENYRDFSNSVRGKVNKFFTYLYFFFINIYNSKSIEQDKNADEVLTINA